MTTPAAPARYESTLESLRAHPVPEWYDSAKLGIFIHWTLAAVPGFAPRDLDIVELVRSRYDDALPLSPYTEWYENAIRFPWSPSAQYHREHYGDRPYASFVREFVSALEGWDPGAWVERFRRAGARYVVFVSKHHDGFCLWPSRVKNPRRPDWFTARDCVGDLADAVRARGMRFGLYYSGGIDWSFNPRPVRNMAEFFASVPRGDYPAYAEAQVRELVARYAPELLWNDISWPRPRADLFRLFADYYNSVPQGLVNDRWLTPGWLLHALRFPPTRALLNLAVKRALRRGRAGSAPPRPPHCDTRTPEYAVFPDIRPGKWECVRGMDKSFGYNRMSREEDFLDERELIHSLADIVSKNGNLLLNVGPRGEDASIPEPQLRRLEWLGAWLDRNGEAIHGTRPWSRAEGRTAGGIPIRFTAREGNLYAILLDTPPVGTVRVPDVGSRNLDRVELLGTGPLSFRVEGADVLAEIPAPPPASPAHVLALRSGSGEGA